MRTIPLKRMSWGQGVCMLLIIAILFTSTLKTSRAQAPVTFEEALHASKPIAEKTADKGNFPGIAIAVSVDGNLVWAEGIG